MCDENGDGEFEEGVKIDTSKQKDNEMDGVSTVSGRYGMLQEDGCGVQRVWELGVWYEKGRYVCWQRMRILGVVKWQDGYSTAVIVG